MTFEHPDYVYGGGGSNGCNADHKMNHNVGNVDNFDEDEHEPKININRYFFEFVKSNPLTFTVYFLLLFLYPLHRVVLPKYYGKVISSLKDNKSLLEFKLTSPFVQNVLSLLGIYVLIQLMYSLMYKVQGEFIPRFSEFSIQNIFFSLLKNSNLDYENLETGEILSKIIKIPNVIYKYLDLVKSLLFSQIMVIATCFYHYFNVSFVTGIIFTFLVSGITLLQYISYSLTLDIELKREQSKDSIYQHFQDVLNNLISVVICKQENHEKEVLHKKFEPFVEIFEKSLNMNFIIRLIFSIFNVFSFILLNYILYKEYVNKTIDREQFISSFIVTYSILSIFSEGYYAIRNIIDMYSQVKDTEDYFNKKYQSDVHSSTTSTNTKEAKFLGAGGGGGSGGSGDERREGRGADKMKLTRFQNGDIEFKNVSYFYPSSVRNDKGGNDERSEGLHYALKNVSFVIRKNENIALVGQIGSGKSTLVKLLLKLCKPSSGTITIDHKDITNIPRDDLYESIFYIPQKPKLLNRTLYDNIMYGLENNHNRTREENIEVIKRSMKNMGLSNNIIQVFDEKWDTPLGVDGVKLSGGQRQIVWVLRAVLRNPSILLLDEPTASLDQEHKHIILDVLKKIGRDKTIIIISHDSIGDGFRKIELNQGELVNSSNLSNFSTGFSSLF